MSGNPRPFRDIARHHIAGRHHATLAHHIVAVGYVVTRDVPGDCIGSGNPARIVRQGIDAGWLGRLLEAHINQRLMHAREAIKLRLAKRGPVALDATYDTDD